MTSMMDRSTTGRDSEDGTEEAVQAKTVEELLEEQNMLLRQMVTGLSLLLGIELCQT